MVKFQVKVLSRNPLKYGQQGASEMHQMEHNLKPKYHPHEKAREYVRAVNAIKWEKLFAKPFLCALSDHVDTVHCLAKHPTLLTVVGAADCAGELRLWNIPKKKVDLYIPNAHKGMATGLTFTPDGAAMLSCGKDQTVRMWKSQYSIPSAKIKPQVEFLGEHNFDCICYNDKKPQFVTAGQDLEFWDINRTRPIQKFNWGDDTINFCTYSRTDPHLVLCCMRDRAVCIYDSRAQQAVQKVYLANRSNHVAWNPMKPMQFVLANEDSNLYVMDCRKIDKAFEVLGGHVDAVLSVDFAPTGFELVSGSVDRTLRLWKLDDLHAGASRDTYVAKRMARVWSVAWTSDNNFILSGSDDCNIRLWKAYSNKPMKRLLPAEARALEYNDKLKERYRHFPEVARISKQRPVPKIIKYKQRLRYKMQQAENEKEANRRRSKQPTKRVAYLKAKILAVES